MPIILASKLLSLLAIVLALLVVSGTIGWWHQSVFFAIFALRGTAMALRVLAR